MGSALTCRPFKSKFESQFVSLPAVCVFSFVKMGLILIPLGCQD